MDEFLTANPGLGDEAIFSLFWLLDSAAAKAHHDYIELSESNREKVVS